MGRMARKAVILNPAAGAALSDLVVLRRDGEAADDLGADRPCLQPRRWNQRRDGDLRAWLFTIQRNLFINSLRRRKAQGTRVAEDVLSDVQAPGMSPGGHAGLHDVLRGLDALPEEQRSILLLVGVEDLSYEQAAQALDIPLGTVMSRLSRARAHLREFMENGRSATLRRVK